MQKIVSKIGILAFMLAALFFGLSLFSDFGNVISSEKISVNQASIETYATKNFSLEKDSNVTYVFKLNLPTVQDVFFCTMS